MKNKKLIDLENRNTLIQTLKDSNYGKPLNLLLDLAKLMSLKPSDKDIKVLLESDNQDIRCFAVMALLGNNNKQVALTIFGSTGWLDIEPPKFKQGWPIEILDEAVRVIEDTVKRKDSINTGDLLEISHGKYSIEFWEVYDHLSTRKSHRELFGSY